MRLVTFATGSRTGVGVRRDGAVFDTGYADMFALISDGSAGLERAGAADDEVRRFVELVPTYDTTGRRRVVAPLVGDTLVVEAGSHAIEPRARIA